MRTFPFPTRPTRPRARSASVRTLTIWPVRATVSRRRSIMRRATTRRGSARWRRWCSTASAIPLSRRRCAASCSRARSGAPAASSPSPAMARSPATRRPRRHGRARGRSRRRRWAARCTARSAGRRIITPITSSRTGRRASTNSSPSTHNYSIAGAAGGAPRQRLAVTRSRVSRWSPRSRRCRRRIALSSQSRRFRAKRTPSLRPSPPSPPPRRTPPTLTASWSRSPPGLIPAFTPLSPPGRAASGRRANMTPGSTRRRRPSTSRSRRATLRPWCSAICAIARRDSSVTCGTARRLNARTRSSASRRRCSNQYRSCPFLLRQLPTPLSWAACGARAMPSRSPTSPPSCRQLRRSRIRQGATTGRNSSLCPLAKAGAQRHRPSWLGPGLRRGTPIR